MSATPTPSPSDEPDALAAKERALLDRQLEALDRLAEMAMALAAAITERATAAAPESDADLNHAAIDFARVSRAVRLTFALQSRLIIEFKGGAAPAGAEASDDALAGIAWREDIVDNDEVQKRQVRGIVGRLAEARSLEGEAAERLVREAGERLEDDRYYRELTQRPLGEIVALICKDLGLEPDWDRLSDTYWAKQEIDRPPPGSPYAGWRAGRAEATSPPALVPSG